MQTKREATTMYNKSEIMKTAWNEYKSSYNRIRNDSFADCLKIAWAQAKRQTKRAKLDAYYAVKEVEYVRAKLAEIA